MTSRWSRKGCVCVCFRVECQCQALLGSFGSFMWSSNISPPPRFQKIFPLRSYIREIELRGLTYADLDCLPCPAGTYASAGAGRCSDCPSNTFSATDGAGECEDCKPWEHAFPGSRACIPSLPCNVSDMAVAKGPCVGGERTVSYSWLQPPACDMAGAVPLPPDTTEVCVSWRGEIVLVSCSFRPPPHANNIPATPLRLALRGRAVSAWIGAGLGRG